MWVASTVPFGPGAGVAVPLSSAGRWVRDPLECVAIVASVPVFSCGPVLSAAGSCLLVAFVFVAPEGSVDDASEDDEDDGDPDVSADAVPQPNPASTAAPTPKATASPPILPTCAAAFAAFLVDIVFLLPLYVAHRGVHG
jgi:hypothetical protein